ncbi:MAG TPA: glycosyl hydrolase 115 family protein [Balneolaceae bacterium]|nr:glycosyl hydrolase 115 family protein [Balneolaceae bacterium]
MKRRFLFLLAVFVLFGVRVRAQNFVTIKRRAGAFPVVSAHQTAAICVDSSDYFVVNKAAEMLQKDIRRVTDKKSVITHSFSAASPIAIIIGSIQKSALIRQLIKEGKINVGNIKGKWEAYNLQVVDHPEKGIKKALVIVGSDRQGTAYGVFTLSRQMGVSPWHWWADVPPKKKKTVFVKKGMYHYGPPAVKYRGIFINDEAPALSGWVNEKFGGFNHKFYRHVFKLMLRLRANYLWPAMWGKSFAVDDTLNPVLANKYGIVMGTAHNEPMMRSVQEWKTFGHGPWNYRTNADTLRAFWRKGIRRMDDRQSIVTVGMRGNGDKPMSDTTNIKLLEKIIHDQRNIIASVTGKPASKTPQVWALYKEVQKYYDQGMRVPKDITLLYSDDNWGNIRRLPELKDSSRAGGFGVYYHFDYVGGPRSYKWLNTNPIPKVWEQMHMAYQYHARRIWIVNVGDLKPMEFPISFFLDYAWNPKKWPANRLPDYTRQWAAQQFGKKYAGEIASIITKYTKYNGRRKPDLLSPHTYSLFHYREAERVVNDYNKLASKARNIYKQLPKDKKAAFYQLVLYPVEACANVNDLYVTTGKNRWYAHQGRAMTNILADSVKDMFARDSLLSRYYNKVMKNGKWNHMMDQIHIGFKSWHQPKHRKMPAVRHITLPDSAAMGVAVQGSRQWWPRSDSTAELPSFNKFQPQMRYIEVFNRGQKPFDYRVEASVPWLKVSSKQGRVYRQKRLWVHVDWQKAPAGTHQVPIIIQGQGKKVTVQAKIINPKRPKRRNIKGFAEAYGYVSMEAVHYSRAVNTEHIHWQKIPDLGRTLSGMMAEPVTADTLNPGGDSPHLEYDMYLTHSGKIQVRAYMLPTLDVHDKGGVKFAVSIDDQQPKIITMDVTKSHRSWQQAVMQNIKIMTANLQVNSPGRHTLKFWYVAPGAVLEKLVVDTGGLKKSYLGPPESYHGKVKNINP